MWTRLCFAILRMGTMLMNNKFIGWPPKRRKEWFDYKNESTFFMLRFLIISWRKLLINFEGLCIWHPLMFSRICIEYKTSGAHKQTTKVLEQILCQNFRKYGNWFLGVCSSVRLGETISCSIVSPSNEWMCDVSTSLLGRCFGHLIWKLDGVIGKNVSGHLSRYIHGVGTGRAHCNYIYFYRVKYIYICTDK